MAVRSIDQQKCLRCKMCVELCPMDVFAFDGSEVVIKYQEDCQSCYLCAMECPASAIEVKPERTCEIGDLYRWKY